MTPLDLFYKAAPFRSSALEDLPILNYINIGYDKLKKIISLFVN